MAISIPAATMREAAVSEDPALLPQFSNEDFPSSHYTHDFDFEVVPDKDECYTNLIGLQTYYGPDPCKRERRELERLIAQMDLEIRQLTGPIRRPPQPSGPAPIRDGEPPSDGTGITQQEYEQAVEEIHARYDPKLKALRNTLSSARCHIDSTQAPRKQTIGIEWESGLAAANDGNPAKTANARGASAGFYSAGHQRGETIWNWPTVGDRVHVEGLWIWDRGEQADTEIHPARLVAIERRLPDMLYLSTGIDIPARRLLATRVDILASGDGGALHNNRGLKPYVKPTSMSDCDYTFVMRHRVPRPSAAVPLKWSTQTRPGNSFPTDLEVTPADDRVTITIPWSSSQTKDDAVCSQTLWLYWDQDGNFGTTAEYLAQLTPIRVTLDSLTVNRDPHAQAGLDRFLTSNTDGGYRVFVDLAGQWFFVNELFGEKDADILNAGLGNTDDGDVWDINKSFTVYVPSELPGESPPGFRLHAGGYLAGGVDQVMGRLLDPVSPCPVVRKWANDNVFTVSVLSAGGRDQPLGFINKYYGPRNENFGLDTQPHSDDTVGDPSWSNNGLWNINLNGQFTLKYHMTKVAVGS